MKGECGDEAGEWRDETAGKVWDEAGGSGRLRLGGVGTRLGECGMRLGECGMRLRGWRDKAN